MYKLQLLIIAIILLSVSSSLASGELKTFDNFDDTIYVDIVESLDGDILQVDFLVASFVDIISLQWAVEFDDQLEFLGLESNYISNQSFGLENNLLRFSYNLPSVEPLDLEDGTVLYSLTFKSPGISTADIKFPTSPLPIEVANSSVNLVAVVFESGGAITGSRLLEGVAYADQNGNCTYDEGEQLLSDWILQLSNGQTIKTSNNGRFREYLSPGTYSINLIPINELWQACETNTSFEFSETVNSGPVSLALGASPIASCARPEISISTPFLRHCAPNGYYVTYCNQGTATIESPAITIDITEDLLFSGATVNPISTEASTLYFQGEDLTIGQCKSFTVFLEPNCATTAIGETHCVEASISPFENCIDNPSWSGADIVVEGECTNNMIVFKIKNKGTGSMIGPKNFIVIEDDVMAPQPNQDYDLDPGDSTVVELPANGKTFRLIAEQEDFHPYPNMPTLAIEGCVENEGSGTSMGFVNQFAESDKAPFTDLFCAEVISVIEQNGIEGLPTGHSDQNLIDRETEMEYLITFQNNGNDPAFRVKIENTINPEFDLSTFRVSGSSHPFTWKIKNDRTLTFNFNDIDLPSANSNLQASRGFLRYKISQVEGNIDGTLLNNEAKINFNFRAPVLTNVSQHTIGSTFTISDVIDSQTNRPSQAFNIFPNPTYEGIWIEEKTPTKGAEISFYSTEGRLLLHKTLDKKINYLSKSELAQGLNFYLITTAEGKMYTGKIKVLR